MRLSSLLTLEDVLVRHPKLRVWAMHAGWPLADDTIAALYAHPHLYVDIGIIDYAFPRKQFYDFLHRLIDAGLPLHPWFLCRVPGSASTVTRVRLRLFSWVFACSTA